MSYLLVFEKVSAPGKLGTTAFDDTVQLRVAVLRPQVIGQVGLHHKLFLTVWLCACEGLFPTVHVGQMCLEMMLSSKLHDAVRALVWFGSLVHGRNVPSKFALLAELLVALWALEWFGSLMHSRHVRIKVALLAELHVTL